MQNASVRNFREGPELHALNRCDRMKLLLKKCAGPRITHAKGISQNDRLILCHTLPTFNDPKEDGFGKHCGKKRKCW